MAAVGLDLDAYLSRIGHRGPVEPTIPCLDALHLAHVTSTPFENLDILLGRPIRLDLEALQDKLVRGTPSGKTETEISEDELLGLLAERFTLVFPEGTRFDAIDAG